jgi:hypothetical protein
MMLLLPKISVIPRHHPDCCLSISTKLIQQLGHLQPPNSSIISIGSGSGLLETLLQQQFPKIGVVGLEVNDSINKYLSPENFISVRGTWDVYDKALEADTWLFVYPRSPVLIEQYLKLETVPRTIVWLGPKRDWEDFQMPFMDHGNFEIEEIEDCGLADYETMMMLKKEDVISFNNTASLAKPLQIDDI